MTAGRLRKFFLVLALCISSIAPGQPAATADALDGLIRQAETHWQAHDFHEFVTTCRKIEALQPGFAPAYNIALGLYQLGNESGALQEIAAIPKKYSLTPAQSTRLEKLLAEARGRKEYVAQVKKRKGGKFTLNVDYTTEIKPECPASRSANCLGLKPEQAEWFIRKAGEEALIRSGYTVPPKEIAAQPEALRPGG